ncbi:hypothetical protein HanIR_Chr09g0411011 [Helianthus annuus]|nr:hypothetical protein HanIR_Chr09g0411011 [Helianthus annuus]
MFIPNLRYIVGRRRYVKKVFVLKDLAGNKKFSPMKGFKPKTLTIFECSYNQLNCESFS